MEADNIVLWRSPRLTVKHFILEVTDYLLSPLLKTFCSRKCATVLFTLLLSIVLLQTVPDPFLDFIKPGIEFICWCSYWFILGILSSVGLGTGLHTFVLYLGPHIASVAIAAYECNSVAFPKPPYPDIILCPELENPQGVKLLEIVIKVLPESLMWGFGTAVGELPPYFMARAARLTGQPVSEIREIEASRSPNYLNRIKCGLISLINRYRFFAILVLSAIPNPFFDLVGLFCGHYNVPFWTFFGATVIGKSFIKVLLQSTLLIASFNGKFVGSLMGPFPEAVSRHLQAILEQEKQKIRGGNDVITESWFSWGFSKITIMAVLYFVISVVNSLAQNHARRRNIKTT